MSLGGGSRSGSALDPCPLRRRPGPRLCAEPRQGHPSKRARDPRARAAGSGAAPRLRVPPAFAWRPCPRVRAEDLALAEACRPYMPPAARMANEMQMSSPPIWRKLSQRSHFSKPSSQWIAKWSVSCKMCNPPPRRRPSPPRPSSAPASSPPPPPSPHKMHSFTFLQNVRRENPLCSGSGAPRAGAPGADTAPLAPGSLSPPGRRDPRTRGAALVSTRRGQPASAGRGLGASRLAAASGGQGRGRARGPVPGDRLFSGAASSQGGVSGGGGRGQDRKGAGASRGTGVESAAAVSGSLGGLTPITPGRRTAAVRLGTPNPHSRRAGASTVPPGTPVSQRRAPRGRGPGVASPQRGDPDALK